MLVESGAVRNRTGKDASSVWIESIYHDTAGRAAAFPALHDERMNVAAADGHVATVKPAHYAMNGHDPLLGRLGGSIYNWNGGHPNGDTAGPPKE
jgi:prepilin-type processing-associated H-X9-DG protein